jgi:hypothetical protein
MKTTETLDCSVFLFSDWWNDNVPQYSLYFDDELISSGEMPKKQNHEIKFQRTVGFGPHSIKVRYENRLPTDNLFNNGVSVRSNYIHVYQLRLNQFWAKDFLDKESTLVVDNESTYSTSRPSLLDKTSTYSFNFESPFAYFFLPKI